MTSPPFPILYEDNHLLAVNKPAGLPTMGTKPGIPTVLSLAKDYIKTKYNKPGNVYLGVVSRLDAPVTGVLLIARTSKAASRLSGMFRERRVEKTYWGIVSGSPQPAQGRLRDWLRKDERHRKMHIARNCDEGAVEARLTYRTLQHINGCSFVEIIPQTGRKHQIRVQMSHLGHPLVGDRKYGSRIRFDDGIALHARRLVFEHPVRRIPIEITATIADGWKAMGVNDE